MNYYNQNPLDEIKSFFKRKTILSRLIIINIIVFIAVNIINLIYWLFTEQVNNTMTSPVISWFAVPSDISVLLSRPWTLFTYMFLQESFFHIFFNMFILYFSGRIFLEYLSPKKLLSTYIWGGLIGGLFYIIAFNVFPVFNEYKTLSIALGASASVLAILIAIATYVPDYSITLILFGRTKLKYIAIALVLIDILSIQKGNPGGHIAHIGGALWGFSYIMFLKNGFDINNYFNHFNFNKIFKSFMKPKSSASTHYTKQRSVSDEEYNYRKKSNQNKIDSILDKISKSGYESLSKEEKELLFKMSNKK
ncbi:MAG: rhomboid family intramembrane serine protease [Bacteroidales bacterium]|nr:rhomboid family intramembrane serine protease [Bacteroidales bacterium]